mgnify:CR=1 FL=1
MVNGMIQYRFDCGSGEGLVRVDSIRINNGEWHRIVVERRGNTAELIIDDIMSSESSAPGTNDVLNLDSNDVYFGAEVETLATGYADIRKGFEGCMKELKINSIILPFSGSNTVGTLQKFEEVEFHCKRAYIAGI